MMIAEKLSVFIVMIICIIASPIEESKNIYIDGIELNKKGDIEPIYCMLQKNGRTIKYYEFKSNGDLKYIFSLEHSKENNYLYKFKPEDSEEIQIDLTNYFSTEDIDRLQNSDDAYMELDAGKEDGKLHIAGIGEVIYVKADAFPDMLFVVHE